MHCGTQVAVAQETCIGRRSCQRELWIVPYDGMSDGQKRGSYANRRVAIKNSFLDRNHEKIFICLTFL